MEVSLSVSLSVFTTRTVGPCYERAPAPVLCATVVRVVGRGATRLKTFPSESESCTCANPGGQPRTLFLVQYVYTPAITHDRRLTLPGPYTPHPTPRTLHHASYTTHPTPRTPCATPYGPAPARAYVICSPARASPACAGPGAQGLCCVASTLLATAWPLHWQHTSAESYLAMQSITYNQAGVVWAFTLLCLAAQDAAKVHPKP